MIGPVSFPKCLPLLPFLPSLSFLLTNVRLTRLFSSFFRLLCKLLSLFFFFSGMFCLGGFFFSSKMAQRILRCFTSFRWLVTSTVQQKVAAGIFFYSEIIPLLVCRCFLSAVVEMCCGLMSCHIFPSYVWLDMNKHTWIFSILFIVYYPFCTVCVYHHIWFI